MTTPAPAPAAVPSWQAWMDGWSSWWWDQYDAAVDELGPKIEAKPEAYQARVQETVVHMTQAEQSLGRFRTLVLDPQNRALVTDRDRQNLTKLTTRYNNLAAGMFVDTRVVDTPDLGKAELKTRGVDARSKTSLLRQSERSVERTKEFADEAPTWPWAEKTPMFEVGPYDDDDDETGRRGGRGGGRRRSGPRRRRGRGARARRRQAMRRRQRQQEQEQEGGGGGGGGGGGEEGDEEEGGEEDEWGPEIGAVPLVPIMVVLGIAFLSVAACAWAVAAIAWAAELHSETALQEKDLQARVDAAREGRTLQPATVTPPVVAAAGAAGADKGPGAAMLVGAVAAVAVGALAWYAATQRAA